MILAWKFENYLPEKMKFQISKMLILLITFGYIDFEIVILIHQGCIHVPTGATGATAVASKFSDMYLNPIPTRNKQKLFMTTPGEPGGD